ncbi:hypothetical protein P9222_17385 [Paenibacillus amylolyticus]|nr:hypothetical protein [Paenibacillus amylolyticus]WFR60388.1 hypothetical protein P9222_17385 [Paenibacillus amylolyticus]
MHLDRTLPLAQRVYNTSQLALMQTLGTAMRETSFAGTTTGKIVQAIRDIEENMFLSQLNQATRVIENELTTHENVLAKLKDRQYPTVLHTEMRSMREVDKKLYFHDDLSQSNRNQYRNALVLRSSDTLWHPLQAHRMIDQHPATTASGILVASRDIWTITDVKRQLPWAVRDQAEDMDVIGDLTPGQRVYLEKMYIEHERPKARRIYVVHSEVDRHTDQAYRESTEYGTVFRDLQESRRVSKVPGYVERESRLGKRVAAEALEILNKKLAGERESEFDSYIENNFHTAKTEKEICTSRTMRKVLQEKIPLKAMRPGRQRQKEH